MQNAKTECRTAYAAPGKAQCGAISLMQSANQITAKRGFGIPAFLLRCVAAPRIGVGLAQRIARPIPLACKLPIFVIQNFEIREVEVCHKLFRYSRRLAF